MAVLTKLEIISLIQRAFPSPLEETGVSNFCFCYLTLLKVKFPYPLEVTGVSYSLEVLSI